MNTLVELKLDALSGLYQWYSCYNSKIKKHMMTKIQPLSFNEMKNIEGGYVSPGLNEIDSSKTISRWVDIKTVWW